MGVAKAITHGVNMTSRVAWEDVVEGAKNGTPRALMIDLAGVRQTANLRKMLASGLRPEISTGSWYRKPASLRNALNDGTAAQRADVVYIIAPDQRSIRQDASESERRDVDARNRKDRKRLDLTISQIRDADPSARILITTPSEMWQGNYKLHEDKPVIEPTERVDIVQAGFGSYTSGRSNSASGAVARDLVEAENPDARVCVFTRHPDELTARLERAASFHHVSSEKLFPAKNLEDALAKFGNEPDLVIYAAAHKDERAALEGDFPVSDKRVAAFLYNRAILDKLNETMLASDSSARVIVLTNSPLYGMGTVPEIARELDKSVARDQFISPATELFRAKSTISGLLAKIINYAKKITVPRNGHSPRSGERQYDILKLSPSKINIEAIFGMHGSDFVIAPELVQVVDPHTGLCVPASAFFERRLKPEILKDFDVQEGGLTACISDCLSPDEISMLECRAEKRASSISNMSYTQAYFWEVAEHLVRVRGGIEVGNTGSSANILPHATKKLVDYLSGVRNGDVCAAFLLSESLPGGSVVNDTDSPLDLDQEHIPQYAIGTFQDGRLVRIHQPLDRLNPYDRNRVLALRGNLKADLDVAKGLYPASKHPDEIAISKMKTQYGFDPKILQKTG